MSPSLARTFADDLQKARRPTVVLAARHQTNGMKILGTAARRPAFATERAGADAAHRIAIRVDRAARGIEAPAVLLQTWVSTRAR